MDIGHRYLPLNLRERNHFYLDTNLVRTGQQIPGNAGPTVRGNPDLASIAVISLNVFHQDSERLMVQLYFIRFSSQNNIRAVPLVDTVGPQDGVGQHCVGSSPLRNSEPGTHPANKQGMVGSIRYLVGMARSFPNRFQSLSRQVIAVGPDCISRNLEQPHSLELF